MSCQMHETAIAKLIKTTEKHRTIITHISKITHCSKSCNLRECSVTFVYHTMKLELFITNTKKLSQRKRLRQRKQVAPAKKSAPAKNVTPAKKIRASKKSRASKKNSPQQRKVAPVKKVVPVKKNRAKGEKLFTRMKKGYISSMKLYARVYGTNRAP